MDFRTKIIKVSEAITQYGLLLVTVLVPLFFLPYTSEPYEFNKSILFLGVMLVVLVAWIVNVAYTGAVSFWKAGFDVSMLALLGVMALSTITSEHAQTSLLGFSGRMSEGLIIFVTFIVFTFIVRQTVNSKKLIDMILWGVAVSGALVGLLSLLQFVGVYPFSFIPRFEFTEVRSFTSIGSTVVLPFFFALLIPVVTGFLATKFRSMKSSIPLAVFLGLIVVGFVISAGNFWSFPGFVLWPMVIAALVKLFWKPSVSVKQLAVFFIPILAVATLAFVARNVDQVRESVTVSDTEFVTQPVLDLKYGWKISAETISSSFMRGILGSGPDTFAYDFTRYRPAEFSSSPNWNLRFTRSSNEVFEILGNTGVFGLAAWGVFFAMIVVWLVRVLKEDHGHQYGILLTALSLGIIMVLVSSFFTFISISVWVLFWLMLGLVVAIRSVSNPRDSEKMNLVLSLSKEKIAVEERDVLPYFMFAVAAVILVLGVLWMQRVYRAEVYYQNAVYRLSEIGDDEDRRQKLVESFNDMSSAIDLNDSKDVYQADYAIIGVNILKEYAKLESEGTEEGQDYQDEMQAFLSVATRSAEKATELNSINVRNWESRIVVYQELIKITGGSYADAALAAINQAILLDPVKPQLYHQRAVIFSLADREDDATNNFVQALTLQPLLLDSRYDLAMHLNKYGKIDDAIAQLNAILDILQQSGLEESDAYKQVEDAIKTIQSQAAEADEEEVPEDSGDIGFPPEDELDPDVEVEDVEDLEPVEENGTEGDGTGGDTGEDEIPV